MRTICSREIFTKKCRQQQNFDSDPKEAWPYNHVTFTPTAKNFMLYCRLIYILSMLYVGFTIKAKVGKPEGFKVGWYPHKITGSSHLKKLNLLINMSSTGLIVIGTVAGALTANPAVTAGICGAGLALKNNSETKDFKREIEISKFAFTTYEKILLHLRTALRGGPFNKDDFLKELNILDDTIVEFSPLETRFEKQYAKQFLSHPTDTV